VTDLIVGTYTLSIYSKSTFWPFNEKKEAKNRKPMIRSIEKFKVMDIILVIYLLL
jgi:hypothetical protein